MATSSSEGPIPIGPAATRRAPRDKARIADRHNRRTRDRRKRDDRGRHPFAHQFEVVSLPSPRHSGTRSLAVFSHQRVIHTPVLSAVELRAFGKMMVQRCFVLATLSLLATTGSSRRCDRVEASPLFRWMHSPFLGRQLVRGAQGVVSVSLLICWHAVTF